MSYLVFLVALVGLPLAALTRWRLQHHPAARDGAQLIVLGIAVPVAILWDRQAVLWGMWRWSTALTLGWRWWGLPVEEIAFIILLALVVMALCEALRLIPPLPTAWRRAADGLLLALLVAMVWCVLRAAQLTVLPGHAHPMYLSYLVMGLLPVLALQWLVGGRYLWHARHVLLGVVVSVAIWYTVADALALHVGIWSFAAADLSGQRWGNVPSEETVFFGGVALLVAQAYLILLAPGWSHVGSVLQRCAGRVRHAGAAASARQRHAQALHFGGWSVFARRRGI